MIVAKYDNSLSISSLHLTPELHLNLRVCTLQLYKFKIQILYRVCPTLHRYIPSHSPYLRRVCICNQSFIEVRNLHTCETHPPIQCHDTREQTCKWLQNMEGIGCTRCKPWWMVIFLSAATKGFFACVHALYYCKVRGREGRSSHITTHLSLHCSLMYRMDDNRSEWQEEIYENQQRLPLSSWREDKSYWTDVVSQ